MSVATNKTKCLWLTCLFVTITGIFNLAFTVEGEDVGSPIIENFRPSDYQGAGQNWDIAQDSRGVMYFANNLGVLIFSGGKSWKLFPMDGVTSLAIDKKTDVIYIGTDNDFGYLDINDKGNYLFVSLHKRITEKDECTRVWYTLATETGVYYMTSEKIYRAYKGEIKIWHAQTYFHTCFYEHQTFWVRQDQKGLYSIRENALDFVEGSEIFANDRIDHLSYNPDGTYNIISRTKGFYAMNRDTSGSTSSYMFKAVAADCTPLLLNSLLYCGVRCKRGIFALGTVSSGLVIVSQNGKFKNRIDREDGIVGNNVNKVYEDNQGNLWLALDNGISKLELGNPVSCFQGSSVVGGIVETIIEFNGKIFLGTSNGLLSFNKGLNSFETTEIFKENIFDLKKIDADIHNRQLLIASQEGLYAFHENTGKLVTVNDDYSTKKIYQYRKKANIIFTASENNIFGYQYQHHEWNKIFEITNLDEEVMSIEEDKLGNLWASLNKKGIYYIQLNKGGTSELGRFNNIVSFNNENGLPKDLEEIQILNNDDELIFGTYNGLYTLNSKLYNENSDIEKISSLRFIKFPLMSTTFNKKDFRQVWRISKDFHGNLWMALSLTNIWNKYERGIAVKTKSGRYLWNTIPLRFLNAEDVWSFFHEDEHTTWIGLSDQVYQIRTNEKYNYRIPFSTIINHVINVKDTLVRFEYFNESPVTGISGDQVKVRSLSQPSAYMFSFPHYTNDFTFDFSATHYLSSQSLNYSTFLEGDDKKWSDWTTESSRSFMNLPPGKYVFHVKAKNVFGTISSEAAFKFTIIPPWYQTTLAYIFFALSAGAFVYIVVKASNKGLSNIIKKQTAELVLQKNEIENKNKEITDSIYYAKRIQDAIMPSNEFFKSLFPLSFILHRPKDIVSGDFYWAHGRENEAIVAAVDCTGHGVPGAFMSMMGNDYMNDIIVDSKITKPGDILTLMRSGIIKALKQKGESGESKDGMDVSLINYNPTNKILQFSGANNPIYIIRKNNLPPPSTLAQSNSYENNDYLLYEIKGNKFPVGIHMGTELKPFTNHEFQLMKDDRVYLFSDGYADQFGGPGGKKLKYTQLKKFLVESMFLTLEEQKIYLIQKLDEWQGTLDQVDDILIIGIGIS